EYRFKSLLRHLPEHAAARFMLGLIYVRKGHRDDGIRLMELAVGRCPWNRHWRSDLAQAYRLDGRGARALPVTQVNDDTAVCAPAQAVEKPSICFELLSGEESTCPRSGYAVIGTPC